MNSVFCRGVNAKLSLSHHGDAVVRVNEVLGAPHLFPSNDPELFLNEASGCSFVLAIVFYFRSHYLELMCNLSINSFIG